VDYVEVRLRRIRLARSDRLVLRGIDWDIAPGQRWVLAGGNGAGKTQLLMLVAGSLWPTPSPGSERRYRFRSSWLSTPFETQDEIAYVGAERQDKYERYGWNHTVEQVVGTGFTRSDIPLAALTDTQRGAIARSLRRLRIADLAHRPLLSLSYGERRLVLLARALASGPRLLLLDELMNGLDERNRAHARAWLESTRRSRLPWVLATHRPQDVPSSATHALVLVRGRIAYRGPIAGAPLERWLHDRRPVRHAPRALTRTARPRAVRAAHHSLVRLTQASVFLDGLRALDRVSVELRAGERWMVHGPNGSGKSTLLRTLYGEHAVAAGGRIERAGIVPGVALERFQRSVGLVAPHLQSLHPPHLSVLTVVLSGLRASIGLADSPQLTERRAAQRALAAFGLAALGSRSLRELSYGQMRRVLFARAWVCDPQLWLLDEPFAGLDARTRHALIGELGSLVMADRCIVLATHHGEEWLPNATHELELAAGRCVYAGPLRARAAAPEPAKVRGK